MGAEDGTFGAGDVACGSASDTELDPIRALLDVDGKVSCGNGGTRE